MQNGIKVQSHLQGREEETIEVFFREKPDRVISYHAIEEMAYLLGVKVSNKDQRKLLGYC